MSWLDAFFLQYRTIQSNGVALPQRASTNFVGFTVADDAVNNTTNVSGGGSGGGAGQFIFQPGGVASGNVYDTWTDLMTAYAAAPDGTKTIVFDPSFAGECDIPSGSWTIGPDSQWIGTPTANQLTINIQEGAVFDQLPSAITGITLQNDASATTPFPAIVSNQYVILNNAAMQSTAIPMVNANVAATMSVLMYGVSLISDAGSVVFKGGASGPFYQFYVFDGSTISNGTIEPHTGSTSIYIYSSDAFVAAQHSATSGYVAPQTNYPNQLETQATLQAECVVDTNISNLNIFPLSGHDGVTVDVGRTVLLVNQTTDTQNGIYFVEHVSGIAGRLVRPAVPPNIYLPGSPVQAGTSVHISFGTKYGGTTWRATVDGSVDNSDPVFYPNVVKARVTLSSGAKTLGNTEGLWILDASHTNVQVSYVTPANADLTVRLCAPSANRTAGKAGTAALKVQAEIATTGSINTADTSTVEVLITN